MAEQENQDSCEKDKTKGYLIALIKVSDSVKIYGSSADRNYCDEILEINGRSFVSKTVAAHADIVNHVRECIKLRNIQVKIKPNNKPLLANNNGIVDGACNSSSQDILARTQILSTCHGRDNVVCNHNKGSENLINNIDEPTRKTISAVKNPSDIDETIIASVNNVNKNNNNNSNRNVNNIGPKQELNQALQQPQLNDVPILLDVFVIGSNAQFQLERFFKLTNIHPDNQNNLKLILSTTTARCQKAIDTHQNQSDLSTPRAPLSYRPTETINNSQHQIGGAVYHEQRPDCLSNPTKSTMLDNQKVKQLNEQEEGKIESKLSFSKEKLDDATKKDKMMPILTDHPTNDQTPMSDGMSTIKDIENINQLTNQKRTKRQLSDDILITQVLNVLQAPSDLCAVAKRLVQSLNTDFEQLINETNLLKLLAIYQTIIQATHMKGLTKPILINDYHDARADASGVNVLNDLLNSVIEVLRFKYDNADNQFDIDLSRELLSILCAHELEAICGAYEQLARVLGFSALPKTITTTMTDYKTQLAVEFSPAEKKQQTLPELEIVNQKKKSQITNIDNHENKLPLVNTDTTHQKPQSPPIRGETRGLVRKVHIDKSSNKALGATIRNEGRKVVIGRIVYGGLAQKSGLLSEGDEILEVNGISMLGKNINQVVELIEAMDGTLSLTIKMKGSQCTESVSADNVKEAKAKDKQRLDSIQLTQEMVGKMIPENGEQRVKRVFVRAFFDFDGQQDDFVPCKELGLSFRKGEILSIIDQSDEIWWQANRQWDTKLTSDDNYDDSFYLAGLIPSLKNISQRRQFEKSKSIKHEQLAGSDVDYGKGSWQEQQEQSKDGKLPALNYHEEDYDILETKKNLVSRLFNCPTSVVPPKRRPPATPVPAQVSTKPSQNKSSQPISCLNLDQMPFYEEVQLFYPREKAPFKRPIIFVGPKMIGQRDLILRLIGDDPARFASPISHTTRPKLANERDAIDFHFVSREQFESDMIAGKFIECGQYQGQYYGTSFESINRLVKSGKTCLHLISIPSVFNVHHGEAGCKLKPFLVFVKPKDCNEPDKLRELISAYLTPHSHDLNVSQGTKKHHHQQRSVSNNSTQQFSNEVEANVRAIMTEINLIENHLLAYFDLVINVTSDIDRARRELLLELDEIEREPQWIPKFWSSN